MATDIRFARLTASLVADTREFSAGLKDSISVSTSWVEKLKSAVVDKGLSLLVDAAKKAGQAVLDLGRRFIGLVVDAAPLEGIGLAFDKMSDRVGLSLDALRQAAAGTVSDFELMKSANVALTGAGDALGQELGKSLPRLLEIARAAARATGEDVGFLFQSLVSGVKRSSPMLIDNTGLVLKLGEANQALADELGIAVSELSAEEKQIALLRATAQAGQAMIDEFGGGQQTAAEAIGVFRAQIQNATDQIGLAFLPVLQAIMGPLGEIGGDVGQSVVRWAQRVADVIAPVAQWFGILVSEGDPLNDFLTQLPGPFQDLVKWLTFTVQEGDPLNDFLAELPAPIQKVGRFVADMQSAWESFSTTTLPKIVGAFEAIKSWVATNWPAIRDAILGAVQGVRSWFAENWPAIKENVLGAFEAVRSWAVENWPAIRDGVLGAVTAIRDWFVTNWPIVQSVVLTAWEVIEGVVLAVVATFQETIIPAFQAVFENITSALDSFGLTWGDVWEAVKVGIGAAASIVGAVLLGLVGVITGVVNAVASVLEFFSGLWASMAANITGIIESISSVIGGWIAFVVGLFTLDFAQAWEGLKAIFIGAAGIITGIVNQIWITITGAFGGILSFIGGFIEGFIGLFQNLFTALVGGSIVPDMMSSMWDVITGTLGDILGGITTWVSDAIGAIAGKAADFIQAGKDLMIGLKDGIRSGVQGIIDAVSGAVSDAIAAAKALLGISSPSLVFNVIGRQIDEGLAGGIIGNVGAPQMAMAAVAAGVTRTAATTINNNFNQTINARDSGLAATQGFETMRARARDR